MPMRGVLQRICHHLMTCARTKRYIRTDNSSPSTHALTHFMVHPEYCPRLLHRSILLAACPSTALQVFFTLLLSSRSSFYCLCASKSLPFLLSGYRHTALSIILDVYPCTALSISPPVSHDHSFSRLYFRTPSEFCFSFCHHDDDPPLHFSFFLLHDSLSLHSLYHCSVKHPPPAGGERKQVFQLSHAPADDHRSQEPPYIFKHSAPPRPSR